MLAGLGTEVEASRFCSVELPGKSSRQQFIRQVHPSMSSRHLSQMAGGFMFISI